MSTFTKPKGPLTWLITGTSSGFGLALARLVLANGHRLIATSRDPSKTPSLVEEVQGAGGTWLTLDVTSPDTPDLVAGLEAQGTHVDVLVNNAGFCIFTPVETAAEEEVRSMMETMYFGPVQLIRAVLPFMRERKSGVVVNISSGASLEGAETMGPYAGAKAGLDGLTRVLAKEVAPLNIRVLTVVAGTFDTKFGENASLGLREVPKEYEGSMVEKMIGALKAGVIPVNSDTEKGMKALYEVISGEGRGEGRQTERVLPLGTDMDTRVRKVVEDLRHALEVFGEVTNSVALDKA